MRGSVEWMCDDAHLVSMPPVHFSDLAISQRLRSSELFAARVCRAILCIALGCSYSSLAMTV